MSSMRFSALLDSSHQGPPYPSKDAGVVADSLTGIHSAMVKFLFVVNRNRTHKGSEVLPQVKCRGFKSGERGVHAVGPSVPIHRS
jgi:hypothetical protein